MSYSRSACRVGRLRIELPTRDCLEVEEEPPIVNFMDALRASLKRVHQGSRNGGRRKRKVS